MRFGLVGFLVHVWVKLSLNKFRQFCTKNNYFGMNMLVWSFYNALRCRNFDFWLWSSVILFYRKCVFLNKWNFKKLFFFNNFAGLTFVYEHVSPIWKSVSRSTKWAVIQLIWLRINRAIGRLGFLISMFHFFSVLAVWVLFNMGWGKVGGYFFMGDWLDFQGDCG